MSLFENFKEDAEHIQQDTTGSGFSLLDSGLYQVKIDCVYLDMPVDRNVSKAVKITFKGTTKNGTSVTDSFYVLTKEGKNKDRNGNILSGFRLVNNLCYLAADQYLSGVETPRKVIRVYDFNRKSQVDKQVPVIECLQGKVIGVAIRKVRDFRMVRQDDGSFITDKTNCKDSNKIAFFFDWDTMLTASEKSTGKKTDFVKNWENKNKGRLFDNTNGLQPSSNKPAQQTPKQEPRKEGSLESDETLPF